MSYLIFDEKATPAAKLPSYRVVEDIPAPEGVVTPEGDRVMMVDLASASLRESALRERIRGLEKRIRELEKHSGVVEDHRDRLDIRVSYWYKRFDQARERCRELEVEGTLPKEENQNLKSMVQSLDKANLELGDANADLRREVAKLAYDNAELKKVQEDLIKRAIERILNETT